MSACDVYGFTVNSTVCVCYVGLYRGAENAWGS